MATTNITRYKHPAKRRALRVRSKLGGNPTAPRLMVRRSNKYIYAQLTDLAAGRTLAGIRGKNPTEAGKAIADKAKKLKVAKIVFDRGGSRYHGQVKALADAAREGGLEF